MQRFAPTEAVPMSPRNRTTALLAASAFVLGLAVVGWIAIGYAGSNTLALAVALLIGACHVAGGLELLRYRQATMTLADGVARLAGPPPSLAAWLDGLDPGLRNAVRLRIEGERVALPVPALTPYLVGMLVLLGMLGTLLGMMVMLRGTGMALETATDLQAMRDSLAAPIQGLGVAFGTSIAGIATSAMLGLASALLRRERARAVQDLDAAAATTLRAHSQAHQREETLRLLQRQTDVMPALVDRLQAMMAMIEQQNAAAGAGQEARQEAFHARTEAVYTQLAASVERSLQASVADGARAATAAVQPVVEATMAALAREAAGLQATVSAAIERQLQAVDTRANAVHDTVNAAVERQLQALDSRTAALQGTVTGAVDRQSQAFAAAVEATTAHVAEHHQQALATAAATFESHAASLLQRIDASQSGLQRALVSQDAQRLQAWTDSLAAMANALRDDLAQAGADATRQQQAICETLARTADAIGTQAQAHASTTIAEVSRLVDAASEAPRAAAEVIAGLRQSLSESMVRDTAMLEERTQMLSTLDTLLAAVNHASTEQRAAIDALVSTSADLLERVGTRFADHVEAGTGRLEAIAADLGVGATEVARLGEAFGAASAVFGASGNALAERLQAVENALETSLARSDEQLAYYVAQAREVVDLSVLAQKQIIEELQQLGTRQAASA